MKPRLHSPRVGPHRIGSTAKSTIAESNANHQVNRVFARAIGMGALAALLGAATGASQVITIDTNGKGNIATTGPVDRRYAQIEPTHVELSKTELDPKARLELIRALESEQGFAMRPIPRGHKGLTLVANGKLEPAGEGYLNMVTSEGLSAKPGARVVITDIKVDRSKIIFDLDGGPDAKHRFLRHIQIGVGGDAGDPNFDPTLADPNGDPAGGRLTLTFGDHVPEVTPAQVKALIAPLISFDVKSPIQAFTDTLPPALKDAILGHKVLVGMTTDMVLFAKGQPTTRTREMDGQMPFEEWIYGTSPEEVDFVRVNGNRVIRLEVARDGEPLQIFTKDVVTAMMTTDSQSAVLAQATTRTVHEGDAESDPNKQAPAAPPSLRNPGETLPNDKGNNPYGDPNVGVMRPVQFPKPHTDQQPGTNPDEQPSAPTAASQPSQSTYPQPAAQGSTQSPAANGSQPESAPTKAPAAPAGSQQLPASTSQLVNSGSTAQPN
ncbi:MAG: hypothetical protein ABR957_13945 [Terracidiphilus sp.]|jgi:hypothetical protein